MSSSCPFLWHVAFYSSVGRYFWHSFPAFNFFPDSFPDSFMLLYNYFVECIWKSQANFILFHLCFYVFGIGARGPHSDSFGGLDEEEVCDDCKIYNFCRRVGLHVPFLHLLPGQRLLGCDCRCVHGPQSYQLVGSGEILLVWYYSQGGICSRSRNLLVHFHVDGWKDTHWSCSFGWLVAEIGTVKCKSQFFRESRGVSDVNDFLKIYLKIPIHNNNIKSSNKNLNR